MTSSSTYYDSELNSGEMEVIGKIRSEREEYNILGGKAINGSDGGLGSFCSGVGFAYANFGFLGCASREISASTLVCSSQLRSTLILLRTSRL